MGAAWGQGRWLLGFLLCIIAGHAQSPTPDNIPDARTFLRAARWRAVLVGDHVYIDGGQVSQEGFHSPIRSRNPINATLSIDTSISWDPKEVNIKTIPTGGDKPSRNNQAYFVDPSNESFYVWGGYAWAADRQSSNDKDLWKFDVDGRGGGEWTREDSGNQDVFDGLIPPGSAACVSTPDAAFLFGGFEWNNSGRGVKGFYKYDFGTREWSQETDVGYSTDQGTLWGATATYVSGFGSEGLVFILGGIRGRDTADEEYMPFDTVHFYDIGAGKWYSQKTYGEPKPSRRQHHCAIGVSDTGGDGRSEIFVYGGGNQKSNTDYGDIWALSLPGFHWTKVSDDTKAKRTEHACVSTKSTMLSFGGLRLFTDDAAFSQKDGFDRGIGIFNLNTLEWDASYNADAEGYQTHDRIMQGYNDGHTENMEWSDEVQALFSTPGGNGDTNNNGGDSGSSTPVGAIAGGVVGGVAGMALVAGMIWYALRRRKRAAAEAGQPSQQESTDPSKSPGYQQNGTPTPPYTAFTSFETADTDVAAGPPIELPAAHPETRPLSELEGSGTRE